MYIYNMFDILQILYVLYVAYNAIHWVQKVFMKWRCSTYKGAISKFIRFQCIGHAMCLSNGGANCGMIYDIRFLCIVKTISFVPTF